MQNLLQDSTQDVVLVIAKLGGSSIDLGSKLPRHGGQKRQDAKERPTPQRTQ
jgi:hypothetical protein